MSGGVSNILFQPTKEVIYDMMATQFGLRQSNESSFIGGSFLMLKMAQHRKSQLIQSRCDGLAQNYDMMSNNGGFMRPNVPGGPNQSGERSITPPHSNMNMAANFGGFATPAGSLKQGMTIGNNQLLQVEQQ